MDLDDYPTPTALLARVGEVHAVQRQAEAELLQLAAAWADAHPDLDPPTGRGYDAHNLGVETPTHTSDPHARDIDPDHDPLLPAVDWAAPAAFAATLQMSTQAGEALIRDALTLRHRLPLLWTRVVSLEVPVWRARRVARAIHARPADVADYLDHHIAHVAEKVGTITLDRLVDEAMLRLHAEERELAQLEALDATYVRVYEETINDTGIAEADIRADWRDLSDFDATLTDLAHLLEPTHAHEPFAARRARALGVLADPARAAALLAGTSPRSPELPQPRRGIHLVVHTARETLTTGDPLARIETNTGGAGRAVLAQQVAQWCGRPEADVKVTEVIDLTHTVTVDRYEIGNRLATRTTLKHPSCVFPWCTRPAKSCDKDHVIPHNKGGPTSDDNLAPLCRRHHRLKTHTAWTYQTLHEGIWLWTDPHAHTYLRTPHGTRTVDLTRADRGKNGTMPAA